MVPSQLQGAQDPILRLLLKDTSEASLEWPQASPLGSGTARALRCVRYDGSEVDGLLCCCCPSLSPPLDLLPARLKARLGQLAALLRQRASRRSARPMATPVAADAAAPAAARKRGQCCGYKGAADAETEVCIFSLASPGEPAYPRETACVFCCPERMLAAVQDSKKKKHLFAALKKFKQESRDVFERGTSRLLSHLSRDQFKTAITPRDHCVGIGYNLCNRSSKNPGGPARAGKGKLCAGCARELKRGSGSDRTTRKDMRKASVSVPDNRTKTRQAKAAPKPTATPLDTFAGDRNVKKSKTASKVPERDEEDDLEMLAVAAARRRRADGEAPA